MRRVVLIKYKKCEVLISQTTTDAVVELLSALSWLKCMHFTNKDNVIHF